MVYRPDTQDDIYQRLRDRVNSRVEKITNFSPTSFNYLWFHDTFSNYLREFEIAALAVQLSGWVDYAGKELTQEDLDALGIDNVDPDEVNKYMHDRHLDELGKEVGVERHPGDTAKGDLVINTTSDSVTIPANTEFGTQPDANGEYYSFYTTEEVSPDAGTTSVVAPIEADNIGSEYNVGSGDNPDTAPISYMPNPPTGVESVYNPEATSGGVDREGNESFRKSIKNAIFENSGGGTRRGIQGYIETEVDSVNSVSVDEFTGVSPPYVDVIVEGGTDADVQDAIDFSRPTGISHNLVRPTPYLVNISATLSGGGSIDTAAVENSLTSYVSNRPLGGDIIRDKLIQRILNADEDIERIESLTVEIANEVHTYEDADGDGTVDQVYALQKGGQMDADGITEVTGILNGSSTTFTEATDYEEADTDGDGADDGIDWSIGGDAPDTDTNFEVTYRIPGDLAISAREKTDPNAVTVTTT